VKYVFSSLPQARAGLAVRSRPGDREALKEECSGAIHKILSALAVPATMADALAHGMLSVIPIREGVAPLDPAAAWLAVKRNSPEPPQVHLGPIRGTSPSVS